MLTSVLALTLMLPATPPNVDSAATVLIVTGAEGEERYGRMFAAWGEQWAEAARQAGAKLVRIGPPENTDADDRDRLRRVLEAEPKEGLAELWVVLIGHGTFDGRVARFNLRGPDVEAEELNAWLAPFKRRLAVINCTASSSPFLPALSGANRVIVTATRSGHERNFTRFGQYVAEAVSDPQADLDKDGQTSLLEAFLIASRRVNEFYTVDGQLVSEHALLDDNGDGLGTPADWFRGIRATRKARNDAALDGLRAHQFHLIRSEPERNMPPELRARRDQLELSIARLRETKAEVTSNEYYRRLEPILLDLARLYERVDQQQTATPPAP